MSDDVPNKLWILTAIELLVTNLHFWPETELGTVKYSRTPLIRINLDGEPSGYAENPDNWIFTQLLFQQNALVFYY
jgi:hypothetical protein